MKILARVMALIGVVYLATVSALYLVQADRAADVENSTQPIAGTVVRLDPRTDTDVRDLFHRRSTTVPVIRFTADGTTHEFSDDVAHNHYRVGSTVPVIYQPNDINDPDDDVMLVKGQDISTLRLIAAGFAVAAVVAVWVFVLTGIIQWRRRRDGQKTSRRSTPHVAASVAVASN